MISIGPSSPERGRGGLVRRGRVQVEQRHAGAAGRETADDRQADTRCAARHDCHPAQLISSFVVPTLPGLDGPAGLWYH